MLHDTTFPTFKAIGTELGVIRDIKLTPYPNVELTTGATIRFRTADDPDRMRGPNLSGVWLDEASQMVQAAFDICIATLREGGEFGWLSATFTPRGRQHWTYEIFGTGRPDSDLIRARTKDNPFLPPEFFEIIKRQYGENTPLAMQELGGEFVDGGGLMFNRKWFEDKVVEAMPEGVYRKCRRWDMAATKPKPNTDPDYTVGTHVCRLSSNGRIYIADVERTRNSPLAIEDLISSTAARDGRDTMIRIEQEPGSSGVITIDHYRRMVLPGFDFDGVRSTGPKSERARPFSGMCEIGHVYLVRGPWIRDWLDELESFPLGKHDDQVDSASGGFSDVADPPRTVGFYA